MTIIDRALRKRVFKKAQVRHNEIGGNKSCTLKNISDTGALLILDYMSYLPRDLNIYIELDSLEVPVRRARQNGLEVGVCFTGEFKSSELSRIQVVSFVSDQLSAQNSETIIDDYENALKLSSFSRRFYSSEFGNRNINLEYEKVPADALKANKQRLRRSNRFGNF